MSPPRTGPTRHGNAAKPSDWFRDVAKGLYIEAVTVNRPQMLVLLDRVGDYSRQIESALEECAVFVSHPDVDVVARDIGSALKIDRLPTIRLLEPQPHEDH